MDWDAYTLDSIDRLLANGPRDPELAEFEQEESTAALEAAVDAVERPDGCLYMWRGFGLEVFEGGGGTVVLRNYAPSCRRYPNCDITTEGSVSRKLWHYADKLLAVLEAAEAPRFDPRDALETARD